MNHPFFKIELETEISPARLTFLDKQNYNDEMIKLSQIDSSVAIELGSTMADETDASNFSLLLNTQKKTQLIILNQ